MSVLTSCSSRKRKQRVLCGSVIWNWQFLDHSSTDPVSGPPAQSSSPSWLPGPPVDHASSSVVRRQSSSGLTSEKPKSGIPTQGGSCVRRRCPRTDAGTWPEDAVVVAVVGQERELEERLAARLEEEGHQDVGRLG